MRVLNACEARYPYIAHIVCEYENYASMRNVTLSVPDDLLVKSQEYARKHSTTLNEMILNYLRATINHSEVDPLDHIESHLDSLGIKTRSFSFNRDQFNKR